MVAVGAVEEAKEPAVGAGEAESTRSEVGPGVVADRDGAAAARIGLRQVAD